MMPTHRDSPESHESPGPGGQRARGVLPSDVCCPWCQSDKISTTKKMPNPNGIGILGYLIFPIALYLWLTTTTFNVCQACGGRWQRGVSFDPRPVQDAHSTERVPVVETKAGMYAEQVAPAAVVRKRARIGEIPTLRSANDVELQTHPGACRLCRQASGRYDARDVPALPIVDCRCEGGCRCTIVPVE